MVGGQYTTVWYVTSKTTFFHQEAGHCLFAYADSRTHFKHCNGGQAFRFLLGMLYHHLRFQYGLPVLLDLLILDLVEGPTNEVSPEKIHISLR